MNYENSSKDSFKISIVILTYKRPSHLRKLLEHLQKIQNTVEIVVVDNSPSNDTNAVIQNFIRVKHIKLDFNHGVAARNIGIKRATGNIVITLDDDIVGISDEDINYLCQRFLDPTLGALCFKVIDAKTKEIVNWCHHKKAEKYSSHTFKTNEITEGAVAFRRDVVIKAGLYPESFFISHEGPDLAIRIMNNEHYVIYDPNIIVKHSHATQGRLSWRRYYYDTRNLIWLVFRNYNLSMGFKLLVTGLTAMAIYSLRDGYLKYWAKGIFDGTKGIRKVIQERRPMAKFTIAVISEINSEKPNIIYMIRQRFFKSKIRL